MSKRASDKNNIKKTQKDWKQRLQQKINNNDNAGALKDLFYVSDEVEKKIFGEMFYEIFNWYKLHPDQPVKTIIFCTAKSVRKTKMVIFKQIIELMKNNFLDAIHLRRTADKAEQEGKKQIFDSSRILANEYGLNAIEDALVSFATGIYLVKDKNSKNNSVIEFDSFDGIVAKGGFPNRYIMHFEELVNPNNANKVISINKKEDLRQEFLANFKFVEMKNNDNFITSGHDRYSIGATNYFTFNRYDENEPALEFCEEYAPFAPVQEWFEKDILNNNVFVKYVDKVDKRWRGLDKTLIVYATKFSNHLLTKNKEWVEETLDILKDNNKEDWAIIIGTLYDGYTKSDAMTYTQKDIQVLDNEIGERIACSVGVDIDYREEICISKKYLMKIEDKYVLEKYKRPIYYVIKQQLIVLPSSKGKIPYRIAADWISSNLIDINKDNERKPFYAWIDDNTEAIHDAVVRANNGSFIPMLAVKTGKNKEWDIMARQEYMDLAHQIGFEVYIEKIDERINRDYINCVNEEKKEFNNKLPKRDELKGRNNLNGINSDEYASYQFAPYINNFPQNFWKEYFDYKLSKTINVLK